jgi:hypothetical protein
VLARLTHDYPDEQWGHIHKDTAEAGYTFPNGVRVAMDVIKTRRYERQVDLIHAAGAHPQPGGPTWNVIDPATYRPGNVWVPPQDVIFNSDAPDVVATTVARLGRGIFWLLRGVKDDPTHVRTQLDWLRGEEQPEIVRSFLDLEGLLHTMGGTMPDPWRDAGIDGRDPEWPRLVVTACELALEYGVRIHWTVFGGAGHYTTLDQRRRFHDQIVATIGGAGLWETVYGFHYANEFNINGFTEADVQQGLADLSQKVPAGLRLSLSSPAMSVASDGTNEDMLASMERLYGPTGSAHFGANVMDIHLSRDLHSKWADPFAYNAFMPELAKTNHEPFGPGASAGGDVSDPGLILGDYQRSSHAGFALYVGHSSWCVWGGRLPLEWVALANDRQGRDFARLQTVRNVWEMPHQKIVSNGLRAYRQSGTIVPIPLPPPPPPSEGRSRLMPGDYLAPGERLYSANGRYHLENQRDGNVVAYEAGYGPYWATHTGEPFVDAGNFNMQEDGNLVLYRADGQPVWATNTEEDGAMCQLQDDGNFVVYANGQPLWASGAPPGVRNGAEETRETSET